MTAVTLSDVLRPALLGGYAVPGLVCLGWEDMRAFVAAAEAEAAPVILQAGPGCRAHTPLPVLGAMMRHLADRARVPVVVHLDHGTSFQECRAALDAGFTSLMYDGSRLPLEENIAATAAVARLAQNAGLSCEGEIGFVGYAGGAASLGTDPAQAAYFARQTGVDALAISVGNVHLQQQAGAELDLVLLRAIEAATPVPLVLHGGSGIAPDTRRALSANSAICKFNIGTELRQCFGNALRGTLAENPDSFDRVQLLQATEAPLQVAAQVILRQLGASGRAPWGDGS